MIYPVVDKIFKPTIEAVFTSNNDIVRWLNIDGSIMFWMPRYYTISKFVNVIK